MSLRKKTVLIVGIASVTIVLVLYSIISRILLDSYRELENQDTKKSVNQVLSKISDELDNLSSTADNWSARNETYNFMLGDSRKYAEENLLNNSLKNQKLNFIIFVDKKGDIFHHKGVDYKSGKDIALPGDLADIISSQSPVVKHAYPSSSTSGFIQTKDSTLMFASRPIINNDLTLPIAGTLIVARFFDSYELKYISESTLQTVRFKGYNDRHEAADCEHAAEIIFHTNKIYVNELDETLIAGYALIKDIFDKPALIVRVDKQRSIFMQGKKTINYFLLALILIGIAFCILIYFFLENFVISKLLKFSDSVNNITSNQDFSSRISFSGKDELSNLGTNINEMLQSLEDKQKIIKTTNDELESRVKERTQELLTANTALEKEIKNRMEKEEELKVNVQSLSKKNKYEMIIRSVAESVNKTKDLQQIIDNAIKSIHDNIEHATTISLYLVTGNVAQLKGAIGHPQWFIDRVSNIPYPKGFTWKTIIDNTSLLCNDTDLDTAMGQAGKDLGIMSYLSVPLRHGEESVGCLKVDSFQKNSFSSEDQKLLEIVARQIDVAIDNSKADFALKTNIEQLSRKNKHESIIRTVTQSVHQSIDLSEVMENAVESMQQNIDQIEYVSIYLKEDQLAVMKAYRGYPGWFIKKVSEIPYPRGFTWKTIIDGKPIYCPDIDKDNVIGPAGKQVGTKSYLSTPINDNNITVGTINVHSLQQDAFDEEDLKLLQIVAGQIEIAINNAKQAEALRLSEQLYKALFDQAPVGVYIFDIDYKITNCNDRMVDIIGSTRDKIVGLDMKKLRDSVFMPSMEKALKGEICYHEYI